MFCQPRFAALLLLILAMVPAMGTAAPRSPREFAWALHFDPRSFDPALADDESAETIRYLTGGVLLRVNRQTFEVEPQLAQSWQASSDGRNFTFHLRPGLRFSDGTPLTAIDVQWTLRHLLEPATASSKALLFPSPKEAQVIARDPLTVELRLAARLASPGWAFDEISIEPAGRGADERITAGPFHLTGYERGRFVRLSRNAYYWKRDRDGKALPHLSALRLDIVANRQQELLRLLHDDYQLMAAVPPADVETVKERRPGVVRTLGPSLDTEQLWFNQAPQAPLAAYKRAWFSKREFRVAIAQSIKRADLARIAYNGHATPADGFISPANTMWRNAALEAPPYDPGNSMRLLAAAGFHKDGGVLHDATGHVVEFSLVTSAGNEPRARMVALIQQDLSQLGIQVTLVTLDFPALIERLMHTFDYDACLLGTTNSPTDPDALRNVWVSSSVGHQWQPSETVPATAWEAEIDRLMNVVASSSSFPARKKALDRVQQIAADQQPFIYLVYRNAVAGLSPAVAGARPSVVAPRLWWNVEELDWAAETRP